MANDEVNKSLANALNLYNNQHNNLFGNEFSDATQREQISLSPNQLVEQVANYKEQIAKILRDREHILKQQLNNQYGNSEERRTIASPELTRWRSGHRVPSSWDNVLAGNNQELDRRPALNSINARSLPNNGRGLHLLSDAPSLMQLKSAATQPIENFSEGQRDFESSESDKDQNNKSDDSDNESATNSGPTSELSQGDPGNDQLPGEELTTTESPPNSETSTEFPQEQDMRNDDQNTNGNIEEPGGKGEEEASDQSSGSEDSEKTDEETVQRAKNTAHAIDEEVDRMTQPTSGVVSQRDQPIDLTNTVEFDDSPSGGSSLGLAPVQSKEATGGNRPMLIKMLEKLHKGNVKGTDSKQVNVDPSDLQADHNHIFVANKPNGANEVKKELRTASNSSNGFTVANRTQATSKSEHKMRDRFLIRVRRSPDDPLTALIGSNQAQNGERKLRIKQSNRRESYDDDDDDEEEINADDYRQQEGDLPSISHLGQQLDSAKLPSKESSLEELLAHKQLLDLLQQSRLPAPVPNPPFENWTRHNSSAIANSTKQSNDHQPADSLYSIDHGLLLYPSADEEHEHKSKHKKGSKSSKKKAKKKETVAMKKGGHKKKKHKMEEKKYHKEKKFKGAKKGKKMSKGKGGKGGKKGKKHFKDKGYKKKGFKNIYVKNEFGQKKSYFDEFRDKDFKKKWKNFDDKYNYAQMKKWQAKDVKGAKKVKDHGEKFKKYDKGKWKKKIHKNEESKSMKKKKKADEF